MSAKDRASGAAGAVTRRPLVAHVLRMVGHYGAVKGNQHAGAVTYFAFLSFFPLLALTFFAVGIVSVFYPAANDQIRSGITTILPGVIGGDGGISLDTVRSLSGLAGAIGLVGVLYTGSGFVLALREALLAAFEQPEEQKNVVMTKISDIASMLTIGGTLLLSVAVGSLVSRFSAGLLGLVGLDDNLAWALSALAIVVALGINTILFFIIFRQLVSPPIPVRSLWSGALLGGLGFELLKQFATGLLALTKNNPGAQAFGIALILIVWLNYFARITLYAACWAHTATAAIAARPVADPEPVQGPQLPSLRRWWAEGGGADSARADAPGAVARWGTPFAAGASTMLAVVAWLRRRR